MKKRAVLEIFGLGVLVIISISQQNLILTAARAMSGSDLVSLSVLALCYLALLPLTAISYRLLATKRISIATTALAQLAAAGPGRIIPGGLGHISIAAVHLSHEGIKLRRAIIITVANNLIGLATNVAIIVIALTLSPSTLRTIAENVSVTSLLVFSVSLIAVIVVLTWLSHIHGTRRTIRRVNSEWSGLFTHLLKNPQHALGIVGIAVIIIFGHVSMLLLAGNAVAVTISVTDALIALGIGVLLGGALPTPGGVGAVEAGTSAALVLLGYDAEQALSTALLFRAVTYWLPLIPGTCAYIYLRRRSLL